MKKSKLIIIICLIITIIFIAGITYSAFFSKAELNITDQKIAKFIFKTKPQDEIKLPLSNLAPNTKQEYSFSVTNSEEENISNVTINYQICLKTFHFMPLSIKLYKEQIEEPILICDESYSRNSDNILVCNSPTQTLRHSNKLTDNYKIEVIFPKEYNQEEYADLVDFIDIGIKSWQKGEK